MHLYKTAFGCRVPVQRSLILVRTPSVSNFGFGHADGLCWRSTSLLSSPRGLCNISAVHNLRRSGLQGKLFSIRTLIAKPKGVDLKRLVEGRRTGRSTQRCRAEEVAPQLSEVRGEGQQKVPVRITTQHNVKFGEVIKIVGGGLDLGDWNPEAGPRLTWSENDNWSTELDVAPGTYDFKCVVIREDGTIAEWEPGDNRTLTVPESGAQAVMEVICPWSDTSATFMSFDEDDVAARLEASRDREGVRVAEASGSSVNPAAEWTDEEGEGLALLDAGAVEDTTPVEEKIEAVATAIKRQEGDSSDGADALQHATKEEAKEEVAEGLAKLDADAPQGEEKPIEQKIEEVAEALGHPQEAAPEQDSGHEQGNSGSSSSSGATGSSPAGGTNESASSGPSSASQASAGSGAQTTLSAVAREAEPTQAVQLTAVALGLLALPIVAWSEYTLKITGCGLPPGPSGLLGAAEGISYVVVLGVAAWAFVTKITSGKGLPAGPGGLLGAVEGLSYAVIIAGGAVLGLQLKDYGYIPAALPDSNCFGNSRAAPERRVKSSAPQPKAFSQGASPELKRMAEEAASSLRERPPVMPTSFRSTAAVEESAAAPASRGRPLAWLPPQPAAHSGSLESNLRALGGFLTGNRAAEAAESERAGDPAPDQASMTENMPEPLKSAVKGVQNMFSGPQRTLEELSSGAEDGLSSADIEPVVDELEGALSSIARFLSGLKDRAAKPVLANQGDLAPDATSTLLPSGRPTRPGGGAVATAAAARPWESVFDVAVAEASGLDFEAPPTSQMPLRWVGMDLGISMAATNAVTAANNVTQNLNTTILQLQSAVDGVKHVVDDVIVEVAGQEGLDLSKLSASIVDLEGTLQRAKENTPLQADLDPLAQTLERAAELLRKSGNGDGTAKTAERLERAAATVREAASSVDSAAIEAAASKVSKTASALPKSKEEAVQQPKQTVEPVIKNVDKVKGLLQSAVDSLGTLAQDATSAAPAAAAGSAATQPGAAAEPKQDESSLPQQSSSEELQGSQGQGLGKVVAGLAGPLQQSGDAAEGTKPAGEEPSAADGVAVGSAPQAGPAQSQS